MTQEEKAKRYEEALALMQDCKQDEFGLVHVRPDEIFHELKRGDEWIRKALLKMVHDTEDIDLWIDYDVHKEEALAWLKKQSKVEQAMREVEEKAEAFTQAHKGETSDEILAQMRGEQKPTEWSEEDERLFDSVVWHLRNSINNGDIEHSAGQLEDWLISLKQRIGG